MPTDHVFIGSLLNRVLCWLKSNMTQIIHKSMKWMLTMHVCMSNHRLHVPHGGMVKLFRNISPMLKSWFTVIYKRKAFINSSRLLKIMKTKIRRRQIYRLFVYVPETLCKRYKIYHKPHCFTDCSDEGTMLSDFEFTKYDSLLCVIYRASFDDYLHENDCEIPRIYFPKPNEATAVGSFDWR